MAREGQGYPCYQRDMMMMMIYIKIVKLRRPIVMNLFSIKVDVSVLIYHHQVFHQGTSGGVMVSKLD